MDTPLYGETTKPVKNLLLGVKLVTIAFSLAAIIVGIVYGIKDARPSHFILSLVIILAIISAFLLVKRTAHRTTTTTTTKKLFFY